ncbi:MAG: FHA domain-containing protein, partial [Lachnospiraceae bacterium]|nr:FHA domain-containing protein [Lachnospiraceae bacterium]
DNDSYYISDLDSSNGTYVNYVKLTEEHKLRNEDIIKIADVKLEFKL